MRHCFSILLSLLALCAAAQTQVGHDIDGVYTGEWSGWAVAMNEAGNRVAVGSIFGNDNNNPDSLDGIVRVYEFDGEGWVLLGDEIVNDTLGRRFGYSVALSDDGSRLAIGIVSYDAPNPGAGAVRVMELQGGQWAPVGSLITGASSYENSGYSIGLSSGGDTLAIGSPGYGEYEGRVRVFHFNEGEWRQLGATIPNQADYERLGWAVALSGDGSLLAAGAPHYSPNGIWDPESYYTGQIRLYQFNGEGWAETYPPITGANAEEKYGEHIALSKNGKVLVAATSGYGRAGRAEVYELAEDNWVKRNNPIYEEDSYNLTKDVSISDDGSRVALSYSSGYGTTRVFEQEVNSPWQQVGEDIEGEELASLAGTAIALSGSGQFIAIGATHNHGGGNEAGHVRVYQFTTPTSSTERREESALSLYPTLTRGLLFVSRHPGLLRAEVYTLAGKRISVASHAGGQVDVSFLPPGAYALIMILQDGEKVVRRFIKI